MGCFGQSLSTSHGSFVACPQSSRQGSVIGTEVHSYQNPSIELKKIGGESPRPSFGS